MTNDTPKFIARMKESADVNPSPDADRTKSKGYRVVSVSLYILEADWIDETTDMLQILR